MKACLLRGRLEDGGLFICSVEEVSIVFLSHGCAVTRHEHSL